MWPYLESTSTWDSLQRTKFVKNNLLGRLRQLSVIFALSGLALGVVSPANTVRLVTAEDRQEASVASERMAPTTEQVNEDLGRMRVEFEENRGQFDKQVRYMARAAGSTIFLTGDEAVYVLPLASPKSNVQGPILDPFTAVHRFRADDEMQPVRMFALRMKVVGANPDSTFAGEQMLEHHTNYFKGNDENKWQTDVPNYGRVRYDDVYAGVSMVWQGKENGETQYDFVVAPNADPNQIQLEFDGADSLEIGTGGDLLIHTAAGTIKQGKPVTFQETNGLRSEIESRFVLSKASGVTEGSNTQSVSFELGEYDRSKVLTIDPTVNLNNLAFSTFLGGGLDDSGWAISVDGAGYAYVTGYTPSIGFPTTTGTYDTTQNGALDVFVAKLNVTGSDLVYSTFIGGNSDEAGLGIAIENAGNAYLTGFTSSANYPTTVGAFSTFQNGGTDAFVTKLNATGSSLLFSTFIGSNSNDQSRSLVVDSAGIAYLTGFTASTFFPTTAGAFDTTYNGGNDVFVTKLNATGSGLLYSTFIGGSSSEIGYDIAFDGFGYIYVTGETQDAVTNYPTVFGAFDTTHNGTYDVFVSKLNPGGGGDLDLIYSTFIGGNDLDSAYGIVIDGASNAYITGRTVAGTTNYPTTAVAFDTTHNGISDIFVTKLNAMGSGLIYSTFIGGSNNEFSGGIAVDNAGNAYLTGLTTSTNYPTSVGAFDTTPNGFEDVFVTKLNAAGSSLIYSTFIGGSASDEGKGIAIDSVANVYITGATYDTATDYPASSEAFQPFNGGVIDAFVSKLGDYAITGRVIDPAGNGLSNVMVAMSGQVSGFMITGGDGRFGFVDTATNQPHTVTANRAGYYINPAIYNIGSLNANRELIFVGQPGSPTGGAGGTLRFANLSYLKGENGTSVIATVERTGQVITTEPVTVDYQTTNGTASGGQDFVQTSGALTFQFGETSKTITVPLMNDSTLEPRESFGIVLSNPTNDAILDPNRSVADVQILDDDLSNGSLLISEFRLRGRLGANDEYIKLFNPNPFDVTVYASDESVGITLARAIGFEVTSVVTIPNFISIPARGHYLLTNNNPSGGFSLIDYPTGIGTTTSVGDLTFAANIPDNSNLVLLKTANRRLFDSDSLLDAVGFGNSNWTTEGNALSAIGAEDSETCFVRRVNANGLQDTNNNRADFLLIDNHARVFEGSNQTKIYSVLGAPAPETSESLRQMFANEVTWTEFQSPAGIEVYDPTPVPNGAQGTLKLYRRITNNTSEPLTRLRLRVIDFPTAGSELQRRFSSHPDFRILNSTDEGTFIKGLTLAADRLQPNGGGLNSTLTIDAITQANPLHPGESVVVVIKLGVMRYGRHPFSVAFEAMR